VTGNNMRFFNYTFREWKWWRRHPVRRDLYVGEVKYLEGQVVLIRQKDGMLWLPGEDHPRFLGQSQLANLFGTRVFGTHSVIHSRPEPKYPVRVVTPELDQEMAREIDFSRERERRGEGGEPRFDRDLLDLDFGEVPDYSDYRVEVLKGLGTLLRKSVEVREHGCVPVTMARERRLGFADRDDEVIYVISIHDVGEVWDGWEMPEDLEEFGSWGAVKHHLGTDEGQLALFSDFSKYKPDGVVQRLLEVQAE